ncbi:MAG: NUDIX hydrolase [Candidatus Levybacteria bacterium]|nr:NUDIX hydrolase [Candidatus Levybacteria bacterium]
MITCTFENGNESSLRHIVLHAIVEKDGKLLLLKRAENIIEGGKWALPGGFLDRDETATEGVLRELKEETGWVGEVISLFRINSNPNRPSDAERQNVAMEFIINPLQQVGAKDKETTKIEWVSIQNLMPLEEFAFDHGETIKLYLKYKNHPHQLPLLV